MKILVTGITGTLGQTILPMLLSDGHEVVGYSRDELKQSRIEPHRNLTLYVGDIRDIDRITQASRGIDTIFHFAALKRVETLEQNPEEAISTNVIGTNNVLHAQRTNHIARVVLSSTDKAVFPINIYGASKMASEKLILRNPNNIVCRYGNVLGSRGSVIAMFKKSIEDSSVIHLTDKRCTRFWLSPTDAASFIYRMAKREMGGICIPPIKAYPVAKLGLLIAEKVTGKPISVLETGLRPGEKLHETLRRDDEGGLLESSDIRLWFTRPEIEKELAPALETL